MPIRKLRAGRVPAITANQYVGEKGTIFWDENSGLFYLSDGVTPGGHLIDLPRASATQLGAVRLGPGVVLNNEGQIIIDSTGLDFSFGDFQATTPANGAATLSSRNMDQDVDIVSNGGGVINMVGDFHVHRIADYDAEITDYDGAVFAVKQSGQIQMKVPLADSQTAALEIVGNDSGLFLSPNQTGVILHVTGNSGLVSRSYFDANASYALLAGRRYNGTQLAPRRVLNNEILLRIVAQAANAATSNGDATFSTFGPARISFIANEDQTPTAQGGRIAFEVTKNGFAADSVGTNTITVASMDAQNGLTATKFNGPLTGNVTGNADTVTNGVVTTGSYSDPSWLTISKSKVGLSNVDNTADANKNVLYATTAGGAPATDVYAWAKAATKPTYTKSEVGLGNVENTALSTSTHYIGTTSIQYNRASAAQGLTGVSIDGSAGSVAAANITGTTLASNVVTSSLTTVGTLTNLAIATNGTITTPRIVINDGGLRTVSGGTTCTIDFAVDSIVLWTAPSGTAAITLQNYTAGAQVKLIIAMTTSRDVTYGISSAANSSDGADNFNGSGIGSVSIANTAIHLEYTCITAVAGGCYVKVTVN